MYLITDSVGLISAFIHSDVYLFTLWRNIEEVYFLYYFHIDLYYIQIRLI